KHRFYDAELHGADWNKMKGVYEPLLEHVANQEDLHDVISMMIGELNASHTGISAGGGRDAGPQTRYPGFQLQPDHTGFYKVTHVYKNGPADKDYVKVHAGDYVLAIDGDDLKPGDSYWKAYAQSPGSKIEFTLNTRPVKDGAWTTRVAPVSGGQYAT